MADLVWCELTVAIDPEYFEVAADLLQEAGAGGVVFDDPAVLDVREFEADEVFSDELLQQVQKPPAVRAYFPVDDRLGEKLNQLKETFRQRCGEEPEFKLRQIHEEDWAHAWKAYYKPEKIGRVVIKPSWEDYMPTEDEVMIALDPGMAFGTGTHPTTRLCVQLLQEEINRPLDMLDLGTGSGILAIVGAKLGARRVVGSDIDPVAVRVARENAELNQVSDRVTFIEGDLLKAHTSGRYDLVVANIIADIIVKLIPDLHRVLKPGGHFVASGIIDRRLEEVKELLSRHGMTILRVESEQEWRAVVAAMQI